MNNLLKKILILSILNSYQGVAQNYNLFQDSTWSTQWQSDSFGINGTRAVIYGSICQDSLIHKSSNWVRLFFGKPNDWEKKLIRPSTPIEQRDEVFEYNIFKKDYFLYLKIYCRNNKVIGSTIEEYPFRWE